MPGSSPKIVNGPALVRWTVIVAKSKVHPPPERSETPTPFTVRREFQRSTVVPSPEMETRQYSPPTDTMRLPSGSHSRMMPRESERTSFIPYSTVESPSLIGMVASTGVSGLPTSKSTG